MQENSLLHFELQDYVGRTVSHYKGKPYDTSNACLNIMAKSTQWLTLIVLKLQRARLMGLLLPPHTICKEFHYHHSTHQERT